LFSHLGPVAMEEPLTPFIPATCANCSVHRDPCQPSWTFLPGSGSYSHGWIPLGMDPFAPHSWTARSLSDLDPVAIDEPATTFISTAQAGPGPHVSQVHALAFTIPYTPALTGPLPKHIRHPCLRLFPASRGIVPLLLRVLVHLIYSHWVV